MQVRSAWRALLGNQIAIWLPPLVGLLVAGTSLLVGANRGDIRVDVALASMAAFLFGILLAFTIGRTRERLALVQDLVAKGNSALFSIHQLVAVFGVDDRDAVRDLVDRHLTEQIDFRLVDYHLASGSFLELTDALYALNPTTSQEEVVYKELVELGLGVSSHRSLIEAAVGQALSPLEWTGLSFLLLSLLAMISVLPGGTALGALVAGVLAGALTTLMVLLRKLDLLRWHERVTIWEPTERLFRNMGRHPYVPRFVIDGDRYRPFGTVRVVDYLDPYPNRATKTVTVEDFGGQPIAGGRALGD